MILVRVVPGSNLALETGCPDGLCWCIQAVGAKYCNDMNVTKLPSTSGFIHITWKSNACCCVVSAVEVGSSEEYGQRMAAINGIIRYALVAISVSTFAERFHSVPLDSSTDCTFLLYHVLFDITT
jgi:hypothetical protein